MHPADENEYTNSELVSNRPHHRRRPAKAEAGEPGADLPQMRQRREGPSLNLSSFSYSVPFIVHPLAGLSGSFEAVI